MRVFPKTKDDLRNAGVQPVPASIRTVFHFREGTHPGLFVAYAEEYGDRFVFLYLCSQVRGEPAQSHGPFNINTFRGLWGNAIGRAARRPAYEAGMKDTDEFMREVAAQVPGDWT